MGKERIIKVRKNICFLVIFHYHSLFFFTTFKIFTPYNKWILEFQCFPHEKYLKVHKFCYITKQQQQKETEQTLNKKI